MNWLEAMRPQMEAKIAAMLAQKEFSPDLVFDFVHVQAAIKIVEAAISETQALAQDAATTRALEAPAKAAAAMATGKPFNFIEEGIFTGNAGILGNAYLTFPRILRGSLFIAICSHVEHVLRQWCRWLHREWSLPKPLGKKAKHESDLQNCMRYLRDDASLALAGYEHWPEWPIIDTYRVARNCLAHDGGIVPDEHLTKLKACPQVEIVEPGLLSDERTIHLLPVTCDHAATMAKAFFERLSKIGAQDPRAKRPGADAPSGA